MPPTGSEPAALLELTEQGKREWKRLNSRDRDILDLSESSSGSESGSESESGSSSVSGPDTVSDSARSSVVSSFTGTWDHLSAMDVEQPSGDPASMTIEQEIFFQHLKVAWPWR